MNRLLLVVILLFDLTNISYSQEGDRNKDKVQVILFLSPDCPVCQKYMSSLNEMATELSNEVTFMGVIPGKIKKKEIKSFVQDYSISFPVVADIKNEFVRKYLPAVTPEVVVLNKAGVNQYQGAIDNWFYELGKYRHQPSEHYLVDAIHAVLIGEEPKIKKTEAIGCIIQADLKQQEASSEHMHH